MPSTKPQFTLRFSDEVRYKIKYIADNNFRPLSSEITMLILRHIAEYEREHGPINVPGEDSACLKHDSSGAESSASIRLDPQST